MANAPQEVVGINHIRTAEPTDWCSVWPFMRRILASGDTFTWPSDIDEAGAQAMWFLESPGHTVVAVGQHGAIVGTAKINPNHMGPAEHIASASFMVDPRYSRTGIGRLLGQYALSWARGRGYRAMQFNAVAETNTPAVSLYRSLGFDVIGTIPQGFRHPQKGFVGLHIMHREL